MITFEVMLATAAVSGFLIGSSRPLAPHSRKFLYRKATRGRQE